MNHIPFAKIKGIFFLLPVLLFSCGEEHALKKETLTIAEQNLSWIPADIANGIFYMRAGNGITESYKRKTNSYYFNKSWSSVLGVNTKMTMTEYHYQNYVSTYGNSFSVSLTAGFPPYGDELSFSLGNLTVCYDLGFQTVSRIDLDFRYKSKLMTDNGYEPEGEEIFSVVEMMDTLYVNGKTYQKVLHFSLHDFQNVWNPFTPREIYIAQHYGLIRYILNNRTHYERIEP